jgi:hypothetical protein
MWEPRQLTTLWAFEASYRESFTFTFTALRKISETQIIWALMSAILQTDMKQLNGKQRFRLIDCILKNLSVVATTKLQPDDKLAGVKQIQNTR